MGRFKKFKAPKSATVIGTGTTLHGDINFIGGLHIDGEIIGNVVAEQDGVSAITLSERGRIEGDIQVPNIILNGTVVGDVYASQRVELAPKSKITGTVYYNLLEMAMGAEVNGQLIHTQDPKPQMLGYDGEDRVSRPVPAGESSDAEPEAVSATEEAESERSPRGR
jgi:cytoskeletal protein CcmA (bactofilin family)